MTEGAQLSTRAVADLPARTSGGSVARHGRRTRIALGTAAALALRVGPGAAQVLVSRTGTFGGPGGGAFELACPAGSVMTGLLARHGAWIDALAPVCSRWVARSETLGEIGRQPFAGGGGGGEAFIRCAGRRGVVTAVRLAQAENEDHSVGHLVLDCGDYKRPERFWNKLGGSADYFGQGQRGPSTLKWCGPGHVAAGIYGRSGAFVDRLGLLCVRSAALAP